MQAGPVYKLLTEAEWLEAISTGEIASALDKADGYVHLSTSAQLAETAARHFAGRGRVRLLRFRVETLQDVRWEFSRNGQLFPHVYGGLATASADMSCWLETDADDAPVIPLDIAEDVG